MALRPQQQISELIDHASHILLTTSKNDQGDGLAALLSLKLFLKKINKPADLVVDPSLLQRFSFLPGAEEIRSSADPLKKLVITLNIKDNNIKEFNYDIRDEQLKIYITPEKDSFAKEAINFGDSNYKYDLIIIAGCPDLDSLGALYHHHADFFFQTTIINLDTNPANERYGQINYIDLNISSCSELILALIADEHQELLDAPMATNLLAGLIAKTDNFRLPSITPETLHTASSLLRAGADQSFIINNLNKNKTISALNLWGRVLARLKQDTHYKLAWSLISQTDFQKSGGSIDDLHGVVSELISRSPLVNITVLLYEQPDGAIAGQIYTSANYNALDLAAPWQGSGHKNQASFTLSERQLILAEQLVINQLRELIRPAH
ncbi:MAG TPA: hypothetical protein PLR18_00085 [bacterium]|nr:hypothetical protein [bacterium]